MKLLPKKAIFCILVLSSSLNCFGSLRRDQVPLPPASGGCLVGGVMYTTYLQTLVTGLAGTFPNQTVTGYRYQYSSSGSIAQCYVARSNFVGPDPNAVGNTPIADIGCGTSPNYGSNTISTSTFIVVQCSLDRNTLFLVIAGAVLAFAFLKRKYHAMLLT